MTVKYTKAVRQDTPQDLAYTFKKPNGDIIDLTVYVSVRVDFKLKGEEFTSENASFVSPKTGGQVVADTPFAFPESGRWMAQFVCEDAGGKELSGEPIFFQVVKNVDDADLDEVLDF